MRILVTRAADDAARTAAALASRGHEAVVAPVMTIVPRHLPLPPGSIDALVATSRHAIVAAADEAWLRLPLFAVGGRTGAAARKAGFKDVRIGAGDGAALATVVALTLPSPATLLYLAGRDRKAETEEALQSAGYRVTIVEAYAAEALPAWPQEACLALRRGELDAMLHFSRRSAELALALADRHGLVPRVLALKHVCLSDDVGAPLVEAGATQVWTADHPDEASLLDRLTRA